MHDIVLQVILCLFLGSCTLTDILFQKIWLPVLLLTLPIVFACVEALDGGVVNHILCGILCGAGFVGISVVTGGQIEKGDGMILGIMGLALGLWKSIAFLFFSFMYAFLAAIFCVVVLKKKKSYRMPFVPFAMGGYITLLLLEI